MRGIKKKSRFLIAFLFILVLAFPLRNATGVYECGGVQDTCDCGRNNFCICCYWEGKSGNCVWYAWHMACCNWEIALEWCTDAHTWDGYASDYNYPVRTEPCENTIFVCEANSPPCTTGQWGHVGWVTHVYPNGSIDVREQGCYAWDGVHSRNIAAQNVSPPMHYIYEPGTSCEQCECSAGETRSRDCGNCGTQTSSCEADCHWGGWSGCQSEGPCSPGATQDCGNCGTQTCESICQWGNCQGEGPCSPGATEGCGNCGTKTCDSNCQWGSCEGEGTCSPEATQACGNCGTQTCESNCEWGGCEGEGECSPGATQICGDAGIQTCNSNCEWGECQEGGKCIPGSTRPCGNCGIQTCDSNSRWGECQEEDPCVTENEQELTGGCGCRIAGSIHSSRGSPSLILIGIMFLVILTTINYTSRCHFSSSTKR